MLAQWSKQHLLVVNPDKNLHIVDETAANQENQNQKQRPETQLSATGNLQANKRAKISGDVARKPLYFKAGQTGRWTWLGMTQEPTRYYELELIQTQMTQKPMLRAEVYARALRASQIRKEDGV